MNYIQNIKNDMVVKFYRNLYKTFLLNEENENILIINQNFFNPLTYFSHYIKKFNVNIYILFCNIKSIDKLNQEIKSEECNYLIHHKNYSIDQILNDYKNLKFSKIIAFHIKDYEYLKIIIILGEVFQNSIYLYLSLSNKKKVYFKNKLRSLVKIDEQEFGNVFDYDEMFDFLNNLENYKIEKINLIDNHHYVTYGTQKTYLFILKNKHI